MASDTWTITVKHYVVLLLDGDGFLFIKSKVNPKLTVKERLLLQLEKYMNSLNGVNDRKDPRWRCWPEDAFRVRIYLSLRDLRSTIARSRRNLDLVDLDHLMETFRSPGMLWDIIDVGPGEDSADKRIKRGDWDANFNEPRCVHLICGITHDQGYVNLAAKHNLGLDKISKHEKDSRRVTLLTCKATHHRYRCMPFAIVAWPLLFNSQPITAEPNYTDAFTKQYTGTYRGKNDVEMIISKEQSWEELALSNCTRLMTLDATELALQEQLEENKTLLACQAEVQRMRRQYNRLNVALGAERVQLLEAQESTRALQKSRAEELQQARKDIAALRAKEKTQDMIKRLQGFLAKISQDGPKVTTMNSGKASAMRFGKNTPTNEARETFAQRATGQVRQAVTANSESHHSCVLNLEDDDTLKLMSTDQQEPGASTKTAYRSEFQPPNQSRQQLRSSPATVTLSKLKVMSESTFGSWRQDMQHLQRHHLQRHYRSSTLQPLCYGETVQTRRRYREHQAREVLKIRTLESTSSRLCSRLIASGGKFLGGRRPLTSDTNDG